MFDYTFALRNGYFWIVIAALYEMLLHVCLLRNGSGIHVMQGRVDVSSLNTKCSPESYDLVNYLMFKSIYRFICLFIKISPSCSLK